MRKNVKTITRSGHCAGRVLTAAFIVLFLGVVAGAALPPVQTFYVPMPEEQVFQALSSIFPGLETCTGPHSFEVENPVTTSISVAVIADGTILTYDHWEDGFEADAGTPVQASTETWGDADPSNGFHPSFPLDILAAGDVVVLHNPVDVFTRGASILYDGGDRMGATKTVALTRAAWAEGTGTNLAGALEIYDTGNWGTSYAAPVGENLPGSMFEYTGLVVMAASDGTEVAVDSEGDGVAEQLVLLGEGESLLVDGGVLAGAQVTASRPVQASLVTGDICSYESRWYTLFPEERWSDSYTSPVGSSPGGPTRVFLHNPGTQDLTVHWESRWGPEPDLAVAPRSTVSVEVPDDSGSRFFSEDGRPFLAAAAADSDGSWYDWGYGIVPGRELTPQVLVGWGPGRDPGLPPDPLQNGSPVWATPSLGEGGGPVRICVDFNGDGGGASFDEELLVMPLESVKIIDPDGDQTGMFLAVCDESGATLAAAWGEDPASAGFGPPFLDVGTAIPPFPSFAAAKGAALAADVNGDGLAGPGDVLEYSVIVQNGSPFPVPDLLVQDEIPLHTAYLEGTSVLDDGFAATPLPDGGSTPFPLDEGGLQIPSLPAGGTVVISFQAAVAATLPAGVDRVINEALVTAVGEERRPRVETLLLVDSAPGTGTASQGYWKNHPASWPVTDLDVGGVTYSREEALALMKTSGGQDKSFDFFRQLAAAKLNLLSGAEAPCILETVQSADAWMATHEPGSAVRGESPEWEEASGWHEQLDRYNNGLLCAPYRN